MDFGFGMEYNELLEHQQPTYYEVLGVSQDATADKIREARRVKLLSLHPDKIACASEEEKADAQRQWNLLTEASNVLLDDTKRKNYDTSLNAPKVPLIQHPAHNLSYAYEPKKAAPKVPQIDPDLETVTVSVTGPTKQPEKITEPFAKQILTAIKGLQFHQVTPLKVVATGEAITQVDKESAAAIFTLKGGTCSVEVNRCTVKLVLKSKAHLLQSNNQGNTNPNRLTAPSNSQTAPQPSLRQQRKMAKIQMFQKSGFPMPSSSTRIVDAEDMPYKCPLCNRRFNTWMACQTHANATGHIPRGVNMTSHVPPPEFYVKTPKEQGIKRDRTGNPI